MEETNKIRRVEEFFEKQIFSINSSKYYCSSIILTKAHLFNWKSAFKAPLENFLD